MDDLRGGVSICPKPIPCELMLHRIVLPHFVRGGFASTWGSDGVHYFDYLRISNRPDRMVMRTVGLSLLIM